MPSPRPCQMNIALPPFSQQRRLRDLWGMHFAETCPVRSSRLSSTWNTLMASRGLKRRYKRTHSYYHHLQVVRMNVWLQSGCGLIWNLENSKGLDRVRFRSSVPSVMVMWPRYHLIPAINDFCNIFIRCKGLNDFISLNLIKMIQESVAFQWCSLCWKPYTEF